MFEEEYENLIKQERFKNNINRNISIGSTHNGYFAQDKKGKLKDTKGNTQADEDVYSLIMKDKERLLDMSNPLRFIFSHSALREGWDNPNVFQICTLKDSAGTYIKRRQEIGRGLRLCVDQSGERVNDSSVNILTVMANESYAEFVNSLQKELQEDTGVRFGVIEKHSFANVKRYDNEKQEDVHLGYDKSEEVYDYLVKNQYIDTQGKIQDKLKIEIDALDMLDIGDKKFTLDNTNLQDWDNPNVFQICTLKHSDSTTQKRQEVGRGLRLCVDKNGNRVDVNYPGVTKETIHDINKLTVIASESYKDFVEGLQKDIRSDLYERPKKATIEYFEGKKIVIDDEVVVIDNKQAKEIYRYLIKNDYIDEDENITEKYRNDLENNCIVDLPEDLHSVAEGVQKLIQSVFDETAIKNMMEDANKTKIKENKLNDNFYKKEFQELWNYINHKYAYTVDFNSDELIKNAIKHINEKMYVSELQYTLSKAEQKEKLEVNELERGESFKNASSSTKTLKHSEVSKVKYDLVGKVAEGTMLTRKSVVEILKQERVL